MAKDPQKTGANQPPRAKPAGAAPPKAPAEAAADAPSDLTERMLGEFRILRRLGHGGMAEVYLAEQTSLKRNVAIKVMHKDRVEDATHRARFQTEALAAAALNHPSIVQVFVVGEQDGIQYIAQEYVPGMNLRELLIRKGPPDQALALRIIRQVANALHVASTAGVVHRDIKPANIMITRKGEVKVADFGLAQVTERDGREPLTKSGSTVGTPLYMSPEQVDGRPIDHRSDLYSLGVTCYHMLSGKPPFQGETALNIAMQHLQNEPEPLAGIRSDLSPLLCRIVHKLLHKDPEQRYQSAQALLKDLKRIGTPDEEQNDKPTVERRSRKKEATPASRQGNWAVRTLAALWCTPDWPVGRQVWTLLLLGILVGGTAAGAGWLTRTVDPFLEPLPRQTLVPKKETAASQFFAAAQQKDNLEAWQAVLEYFPGTPDRLYRNYAEQQLAVLYLARRRNDDAQPIFDRFAEMSEPQFRAFGLAGQAILWSLRSDYQKSQQTIDKLRAPVRPNPGTEAPVATEAGRRPAVLFDLLDDRMKSAVSDTLHGNIEKLNQQISHEWEEIFRPGAAGDAPAAPSGESPG